MANQVTKSMSSDLKKYAEAKSSDILALCGDKVKAEKFKTDLALLSLNRGLANCSTASVFTVALNILQIGLSIVKEQKQAYIVPFKGEATLQIGYIGWQILAKRAGYKIDCELVYKCDEFEYIVDENGKNFKFRANLLGRQDDSSNWIDSNLVGAMVWASDSFGTTREFISARKLGQIKNTSQSVKAGKFSAWSEWAGEMYKAKAIKYVASKLPTEDLRLQEAVNFENSSSYTLEKDEPSIDLNAIAKSEETDSETGEIYDVTPEEQGD